MTIIMGRDTFIININIGICTRRESDSSHAETPCNSFSILWSKKLGKVAGKREYVSFTTL
jgi:hypothetical protein